ncbi:hypothetical protein F5Y16DRAFT_421002 [Xylariaceae sp. FL0255]|nr:hypothetical protein F5Y16DRAFT_421002 [Xylariaceae sp. FL0255]
MLRTKIHVLRSILQSKSLTTRMTSSEANSHLAVEEVSNQAKSACDEMPAQNERSQSEFIRSQSLPDSGYDSFSERKVETSVNAPGIAFPGKPIPPELQTRFEDIKRLFGQPLLDLISKKRILTRDVSMKLRWMGSAETSSRLYIVIQCDKRAVKYIKHYFTQAHVREEVGADFLVHVIPGLRRLSNPRFKVYEDDFPTQKTLCGTSIKIENPETKMASMATLGGLVAVEKVGSETKFFGLTAGHSLELLGAPSDMDVPELEVCNELSDEDSDSDTLHDEESSPHLLFESSSRPMPDIGTIEFHSFQETHYPENHDWAVIALDRGSTLPNLLVDDYNREGKALKCGDELMRINGTVVPPLIEGFMGVSVLTPRGIQKGRFAPNTSSLFMAPGKQFLDTYDFIPGPGFGLQPGDSGSWAVCDETGGVLGHVVSVDSIGEGHIIPILGTLEDIKIQLGVDSVFLPSRHDLERRNTDLKQRITNLEQRNTDLKQQIADLKQRNTDFKQRIADFERRTAVDTANNSIRHVEIDDLLPYNPLSAPLSIGFPGQIEMKATLSNDSGYASLTTNPPGYLPLEGQEHSKDMGRNYAGFQQQEDADVSEIDERLSPLLKTQYVRPKRPMVFCDQCDEHRDGFRGEHELRRHKDLKHKQRVKEFICVDPRDAAAHLRRSHFTEKSSRHRTRDDGDGSSIDQKRRGKGGGDWPSMHELKNWMREVWVNPDDQGYGPLLSETEDTEDALNISTVAPERTNTPPSALSSAAEAPSVALEYDDGSRTENYIETTGTQSYRSESLTTPVEKEWDWLIMIL